MAFNSSTKSAKVLIVAEYGEFGGTLTFLRNLLLFHRNNHIQSAIVIEEQQNNLDATQSFIDEGVLIYAIPNRLWLLRKPYFSIIYDYLCIRNAVRKYNPDFILVSTGTPSLWLGLLIFPFPVTFIIHTYPEQKFRWGMRLFITLMNNSSNHFVTVSDFSSKQIQKCMDIAPERVSVIYNSFSTSKTGESITNKKKIILTVGHVVDYKNPIVWLEVAQKVLSYVSDIQFIWLGEGDLLPELISQVSFLGLDDKILFPGYCKDVNHYYAKSMVYFHPSLIESHGIAVVEAMAHGLPCVTSNVGGLPESVVHGDTGYICSPDNIQGFSTHLLQLIENKQLRETMGQAGRQRAFKYFSSLTQEESLLRLYQQMMFKKHDSPNRTMET